MNAIEQFELEYKADINDWSRDVALKEHNFHWSRHPLQYKYSCDFSSFDHSIALYTQQMVKFQELIWGITSSSTIQTGITDDTTRVFDGNAALAHKLSTTVARDSYVWRA